jgi:hypothetical protein
MNFTTKSSGHRSVSALELERFELLNEKSFQDSRVEGSSSNNHAAAGRMPLDSLPVDWIPLM